MKNSEQHIIDLLRNKLESHESPVDPTLWNGIESSLGSANAAGAGAAAKGTTLLKWVAAAIVAGVVATTVVVLNQDKQEITQEVNTGLTSDTPEVNNDENKSEITGEEDQKTVQKNSNISNTEPSSLNEISQVNVIEEKNEDSPKSTQDKPDNLGEPTSGTQNSSGSEGPPSQPRTELPGSPGVPSTPRAFDAGFEMVRVSEGDLKFFFFPNYPDEAKYVWIVDGVEISQEISTSFTFEEGVHSVSLHVTSQRGLDKTTERTVEAWYPAKLVVPNVFSPNNDPKNRCFDVMALSQNISVDKVLIFDSKGAEMFISTEGNDCWDGTDKFGNHANEGTYLWIVQFHDNSGKVIEQKGKLTLLRQ